jgi:surface protein
MKRTVALGAVVFSLLLWSCGGDSTPTTPTPTPVATSITLSVTSLSFDSLGATSQISATVKDQNGATMNGATVTWATSDAAVATVSVGGLVISVADGTATITATSGSVSATALVSVVRAFYLAANGVTVMCSVADVGQTGIVGGIVYTKRSEAQIDALVDGEDYVPLATTCTSSITNMYGMFAQDTAFNQDISSWDVSSVTNMELMFNNATAFNQDLSDWCVSLINSEPTDFDTGATSWVLDRPVWGTCPS